MPNGRFSGSSPALIVCQGLTAITIFVTAIAAPASAQHDAPNVLFAIADDWGFPHASAYGDPVVETPSFDRIAREGALAHHAYVSSPSCTPSRGAILTGQWHWRLEGAANLWSVFPDRFETYQELLKAAGYRTGMTGKGWGAGTDRDGGPGTRREALRELRAVPCRAGRSSAVRVLARNLRSAPPVPARVGRGERHGPGRDPASRRLSRSP